MVSRSGNTMYHFHIKPISKDKGHNLAGKLSYIQDKSFRSLGRIENRTKKRPEPVIEISSLPNWFLGGDTQKYINAVDKIETRINSRFGREIELALITEMNDRDKLLSARVFLGKMKEFGIFGVGAVHDINSINPHCHIVINDRELLKNGTLGRKLRENNSRNFLVKLRRIWAETINYIIKAKYANDIFPVTPVSFKAMGYYDYKPTRKIGYRRWREKAEEMRLENDIIMDENIIKKHKERMQKLKEEQEQMAQKRKEQELLDAERRKTIEEQQLLEARRRKAIEEQQKKEMQEKKIKEQQLLESERRKAIEEQQKKGMQEEKIKEQQLLEARRRKAIEEQQKKGMQKTKKEQKLPKTEKNKAIEAKAQNASEETNHTIIKESSSIKKIQSSEARKQKRYREAFWHRYIRPIAVNSSNNSHNNNTGKHQSGDNRNVS